MDGTQRFIAASNIGRFIEQLESSEDARQRDVLRRLLVEEEERFGRASERLSIADDYIARAKSRISEQEQRLEILRAKGHNTAEAERLLSNMKDVRDLLSDMRRHWAAAAI